MRFSWSAEWTGTDLAGVEADDGYTGDGDAPLPERLLSFVVDCFRAAAKTSRVAQFRDTLEDVAGPFIAPEPVVAGAAADLGLVPPGIRCHED